MSNWHSRQMDTVTNDTPRGLRLIDVVEEVLAEGIEFERHGISGSNSGTRGQYSCGEGYNAIRILWTPVLIQESLPPKHHRF